MEEQLIHKVGRIDQIVRDFFEEDMSINEIMAKDLMPLFLEKGVFKKDHRNGLPIRNVLRNLDANNKLYLLSHVKVVRNPVNRRWYFVRL